MPGTKTHSITIRVSTQMLHEIDRGRGAVSRGRFIMDAIEARLALRMALPSKLKAPKRSKVTNAISAGTDLFKTGRYES
ncbi:MAG TPA: hypothetical protein VEU96_25860 [Bryobacteraceae bacterium]|nr:hypothetical protein [Bryobacteraceae bacterium]